MNANAVCIKTTGTQLPASSCITRVDVVIVAVADAEMQKTVPDFPKAFIYTSNLHSLQSWTKLLVCW